MRRWTTIVIALLWATALAACGGSPSPTASDALDGVAGYWSVPGHELAVESFLLRVEERDGAYWVSVDGGPLVAAEAADGRLVLPVTGPGSRNLEFGIDGGRAAVFGYVSHGENAAPGEPTGSFWKPCPVRSLSPSTYEEKAAAKADERMRWELLRLDLALRVWAERHGGRPPAAADVAEDGAFGRWMTTESAAVEVPWPVNPYTGEAMHAGNEPGDFTYTRRGDDFTLVGRLHDGSRFSTRDASSP